LQYIRDELKPKYKIGILSNISNHQWFREYFTKEELAMFDEVVLSIDAGVVKPDPRIFELITEKLKAELKEVVFIDDRMKNVGAAKKLGMKAILYEDTPKLKQKLQEIL
jgi:epoxide hydrolase-like predicted phosphatase